VVERAQEHSDHAWLSGTTISGDVFFFVYLAGGVFPSREVRNILNSRGWGCTTVCPKQAEITRSPDLDLPPSSAQLPHEDVVFIPHVSLQAILVLDSPDVDLRLWNETVAEMEASGK